MTRSCSATPSSLTSALSLLISSGRTVTSPAWITSGVSLRPTPSLLSSSSPLLSLSSTSLPFPPTLLSFSTPLLTVKTSRLLTVTSFKATPLKIGVSLLKRQTRASHPAAAFSASALRRPLTTLTPTSLMITALVALLSAKNTLVLPSRSISSPLPFPTSSSESTTSSEPSALCSLTGLVTIPRLSASPRPPMSLSMCSSSTLPSSS